MNFNSVKKDIKKLGLKPATERNLSLFTFSCVARAYTIELNRIFGFSYIAIAAFGKNNFWHSFYNEKYIAIQTRSWLKKYPYKLRTLLKKAALLCKKSQKTFLSFEKTTTKDLKNLLFKLSEPTVIYMTGMGIYNCIWRLTSEFPNDKILKSLDLNKIAKVRQSNSKFYPQNEIQMNKIWRKLEKIYKLPKSFFNNLSLTEIESFIKNPEEIPVLKTLSTQRKKKFIYYFDSRTNNEYISHDNNKTKWLFKQIYNCTNKTSAKGLGVYPGKLSGKIFIKNTQNFSIQKGRFILLAPSTHPNDILLIKKALAIITDEGGVLSHAAIISRELGIPCIVGTKIATKIFKNGDMVNLNATKGTIEKI